MKSVWLCPTRSRPENIKRLIGAWSETGATAQLQVWVDDDDPTLDAYMDLPLPSSGLVSIHVGPRLRLGPTLNAAARQAATWADTVGFLGDDHVPRTVEFDAELHDAIQDQGGGLAYGNDLLQGENLATAVLQDAAIIRSVGHFCPPAQVHLYLDDYWMALGVALNKLTYCDDVVIEHMHFLANKAERDEQYSEVNSQQMYDHDRIEFEKYRQTFFDSDVARIKSGLWA